MGKKIGKYELARVLGGGGKARLATDSETGQVVVVKVLDKAQLAQDKNGMEASFKNECVIGKILGAHPNIEQQIEVLQTASHIYRMSECIDGGDLFDKVVSSQKLSEDATRTYAAQLVSGLVHAHAKGVSHGDIKPENLLLTSNDVLKISGWGMLLPSKEADNNNGDSTRAKKLLVDQATPAGTPNYVAPEVLTSLDSQLVDRAAADVWSCGVTLFAMASGYLPFDDPSMQELFKKIEKGKFKMCSHFSPDLCDLIQKMLVVDPEERISLNDLLETDGGHPWFQVTAVGFSTQLQEGIPGNLVPADLVDHSCRFMQRCDVIVPERRVDEKE